MLRTNADPAPHPQSIIYKPVPVINSSTSQPKIGSTTVLGKGRKLKKKTLKTVQIL